MESKGKQPTGGPKAEPKATPAQPEKARPTAAPEKKETPEKRELPVPPAVPTPKKPPATALADPALLNNHSNLKPGPVAPEPAGPEPAGPTPDSEARGAGAGAEDGEAAGGGGSGVFENLKPLLLAGGAAVALLAVIVGVAFLARKK
ncbi:cell cycle exit and neuronal differentiation protein 1 [Ornithorhynchus anatinus]|uniref:Cell cycle exit and neuronal differentiation 1 n=1 Tax=Ornithorhynchus anatinus TaxID=9258 RepID=A0A6I8P364_ORNAN|nr:cell cycle exit and neuronal differentiation protein 1 [Ornithorhynchus anatinus]